MKPPTPKRIIFAVAILVIIGAVVFHLIRPDITSSLFGRLTDTCTPVNPCNVLTNNQSCPDQWMGHRFVGSYTRHVGSGQAVCDYDGEVTQNECDAEQALSTSGPHGVWCQKFINGEKLLLSVVRVVDSKNIENTNNITYSNTSGSVFGLQGKEKGTELYYSEKLGVGFTYLPYNSEKITPVEDGDKISIFDQTIEVFTKDPSISFEEAINQKFLQGYDPSECYVKTINSDYFPEEYVVASIAYPPANIPGEAWFANSVNCPRDYSQTNGAQYFLYNSYVPEKYIFVKIGQYSAASDGTPVSTGHFNWTNSIRILK